MMASAAATAPGGPEPIEGVPAAAMLAAPGMAAPSSADTAGPPAAGSRSGSKGGGGGVTSSMSNEVHHLEEEVKQGVHHRSRSQTIAAGIIGGVLLAGIAGTGACSALADNGPAAHVGQQPHARSEPSAQRSITHGGVCTHKHLLAGAVAKAECLCMLQTIWQQLLHSALRS